MPRSIYANLRNRGDEDFLTEIFVETLRRAPTLGRAALALLAGRTDLRILRARTQVTFGQDRPDMLIDALDTDDRAVRLLVEAKLEHHEGPDQLPRYARMLVRWCSDERVEEGHLVYLTARYDPRTQDDVFGGERPHDVTFSQCRWKDIHALSARLLPGLQGEEATWTRELVRYLEDRKLSQPTQFTPRQLDGLSQLPELVRLLEACLDDPVWSRFKEVAGDTKATARWANQLLEHDRFLYFVHQTEWWWIGMGFLMRDTTTEGYPDCAVILETPTEHSEFRSLIEAFQGLAKEEEAWSPWQPSSDWPGVAARRSLREFLAEEDHVQAVQNWVLARLGEVERFRTDNPSLPWGSGSGEAG